MPPMNLANGKNPQKRGVVVPFRGRRKNGSLPEPQACIFCGTTVHTRTFKGKIVCQSCLQYIPTMFVL